MHKRHLTIGSVLLFPFTLIFRIIVVIRNLLFDWEIIPSKEFDLPVISVGNITVGGTGKTPHVEYLVELLNEEFRLAVLSRGYKRRTRNFIIAGKESTAAEIGDEPRQMKQKFPGIIVAVDRKRVHGIEKLIRLPEQVDVVLLDDAYQHRHVKPGKSILLVDYNRLILDDFMLPSGRLREPASGKDRANIILVTRSPERVKPIEFRNIAKRMKLGLHQHLFFTTMDFGNLNPVYNIDGKTAEWFSGKKAPVLMVTGIANPRTLRKYARSISPKLTEINYPDHHQFTRKDIEKIATTYRSLGNPDAIVLTTEKDAMRLQEMEPPQDLKQAMYYITIHVRFLNDHQQEFNKLITDYVRSNKRDNILHKKQDRNTA